MNKEVKEKWVTALRSGNYKQTSHELKNENGYCCLGVLCDLAVKEGICQEVFYNNEDDEENIDENGYINIHSFDNQTESLPKSVQTWAQLDSDDPFLYKDYENVSCSLANDNRKLTFHEIADLIENVL